MRAPVTPWGMGLALVGVVVFFVGLGMATGLVPQQITGCGNNSCIVGPVLSVAEPGVVSSGSTASFTVTLYVYPATNHLTSLQVVVQGQPPQTVPLGAVTTGQLTLGPVSFNLSATGTFTFYAAANSTYVSTIGAATHLASKSPVGTLTMGKPVSNPCTASSCPYISPAFTFQQDASGLGVAFDDTSTLRNATPTGNAWSFGDGSAVVTGSAVHHVYGAPGTYAVTLTENAQIVVGGAPQSVQASVTMNVTVTASGGGGGGGTGAPAPPPSLSVGPLAAAFLVTGASLALLQALPVIGGRPLATVVIAVALGGFAWLLL